MINSAPLVTFDMPTHLPLKTVLEEMGLMTHEAIRIE